MLDISYDYASCIASSEKVAWKLDEVMPTDRRLDFTKPFLPKRLSGASEVPGLSQDERLRLNQITGNAYLNLFAFVEEYIIAVAVQHAHAELFGDHDAVRALCRFADEEVKHQKLFYRYVEAFSRDFGSKCEVLGSAAEVAGVILSKSPIAVMIVTLHLEIMTLQHYTDCVRDDADIDPFFASLLRHHWMEESQHARLDALELDKLATGASKELIEAGVDDYLGILSAFDGLLKAQAELDAASLSRKTGKELSPETKEAIIAAQHRAYRRTFLTYGMNNKQFLGHIEKLTPAGREQIEKAAAGYE